MSKKNTMSSNDNSEAHDLIHNLRTSMAVINGFLNSIGDLSMNEQQREYYEAAVRSGKKIEALTSPDVGCGDKNLATFSTKVR